MNRRLYQIILLIVVIGFTVLLTREGKPTAQIFPYFDKFAHFSIFFILAILVNHAYKAPIWLHLILLAFYGIVIELLQQNIAYRYASIDDVIANILGAICYFSFCWLKNRCLK